MFKIIGRIDKFLPLFLALGILGSAIGCEWFLESSFELASASRLQKWITLPTGLTRADVSITMSYYYVLPWGRGATFILQDTKGQIRTKVSGKERGGGPSQLKHPPPGFPPGYPAYEVITVSGITDIIDKVEFQHKAEAPPLVEYCSGE